MRVNNKSMSDNHIGKIIINSKLSDFNYIITLTTKLFHKKFQPEFVN